MIRECVSGTSTAAPMSLHRGAVEAATAAYSVADADVTSAPIVLKMEDFADLYGAVADALQARAERDSGLGLQRRTLLVTASCISGRVIVDVDDVDFHADDGVLTVIATLTTDAAVDSTVISELAAQLERAAREVYVLIGTLIVVIEPRDR